NLSFFAFLARRRGWLFAAAAVPLHLLYYCCCGLSVVIAAAHWRIRRPATVLPRVDPAAEVGVRSAGPVPHGTQSPRGGGPGCYVGPLRGGEHGATRHSFLRLAMRIGIDGSCLSNRRGFGRFARRLVEALARQPTAHRFTVFIDRPSAGIAAVPDRFE